MQAYDGGLEEVDLDDAISTRLIESDLGHGKARCFTILIHAYGSVKAACVAILGRDSCYTDDTPRVAQIGFIDGNPDRDVKGLLVNNTNNTALACDVIQLESEALA